LYWQLIRCSICWLLDNSCDSIEQLQPLYHSQGIDFCRRTQAALDNPDYLTNLDYLTNPDHPPERLQG
jgi:hypothetical protein